MLHSFICVSDDGHKEMVLSIHYCFAASFLSESMENKGDLQDLNNVYAGSIGGAKGH